jgi:hypothetical protein
VDGDNLSVAVSNDCLVVLLCRPLFKFYAHAIMRFPSLVDRNEGICERIRVHYGGSVLVVLPRTFRDRRLHCGWLKTKNAGYALSVPAYALQWHDLHMTLTPCLTLRRQSCFGLASRHNMSNE